MNWDDLRYFLAVAGEGSLSGAARSLHVNPATVSRHVDALEERFAVRLFDRRQDGYGLTPAGEKLLARSRGIESEMFALGRAFDAEDRGLAGTVTVTATESLTVPFLIRNLPLLEQRHPGIRLHLVNEYRMLNLSRREADVAIRLARPEQGDLSIRKIGVMGFGLYASPTYLELHGAPKTPGDLRDHRVIDWLDGFPENVTVTWLRRQIGDTVPIFSTNPASARLAAARMGVGIALVPCMVAEGVQGVVRLLPDEAIPGVDLWLLVHRDLARLAKVRAVLDFIYDRAQSEADRIAGRLVQAG
ncbi:LysR family transcriptional regulator [Thalassobaculum sp.]|uniref:LysR family transcriptional regulator n=1 Tax=Thalassobaculum sp. TaxID=2022740 RepID=UPI0032EC1223